MSPVRVYGQSVSSPSLWAVRVRQGLRTVGTRACPCPWAVQVKSESVGSPCCSEIGGSPSRCSDQFLTQCLDRRPGPISVLWYTHPNRWPGPRPVLGQVIARGRMQANPADGLWPAAVERPWSFLAAIGLLERVVCVTVFAQLFLLSCNLLLWNPLGAVLRGQAPVSSLRRPRQRGGTKQPLAWVLSGGWLHSFHLLVAGLIFLRAADSVLDCTLHRLVLLAVAAAVVYQLCHQFETASLHMTPHPVRSTPESPIFLRQRPESFLQASAPNTHALQCSSSLIASRPGSPARQGARDE